MFKRGCALVGVALLGAALAANKTYSNSAQGYSFSYPATWQAVTGLPGNTTSFQAPGKALVPANVSVSVIEIDDQGELSSADLKARGDDLVKDLKQNMPDYTLIKLENTKLGGKAALSLIYSSGNNKNGLQVYQLQSQSRGKFYVVSFTAPKSSFAGLKSTFDDIKNSFKLR